LSLNGLKLDLRTAPDFRAKLIKCFVTASWFLAIISFVLTCFAFPPIKVVLNYFLNLSLPTASNPLFFEINFGFIVITFLVSIFGVILNLTRNRRRSDQFYFSLIIISILSGISAIIGMILI